MEIIDHTNPNIRIVKNFLNKNECESILKVKELSEELWALDYNINYPKQENIAKNLQYAVSQWDGMCINITNPGFAERYGLNPDYYNDLAEKIKSQIRTKFQVSTLKPEQYLINRWRIGRDQAPHLDYFYQEEEGHNYDKLAKNSIPKEFLDTFGKMFQTKHYSSLIYLNDDYEGGELYFPEYNFSIKPEAGTLICLKGDENSLHGVKKITAGIRYTISLFWEDTEYKNKIKFARL
jgi:hypothetical protein